MASQQFEAPTPEGLAKKAAARIFRPLLELFFDNGELLDVRQFSVRERISSLFEIEVMALSPNDDVDLEALVGKKAGFALQSSPLVRRVWTGVCCHAEQMRVDPTGLSTYLVKIVPRLWLLDQRRGHRIFQHAAIPDIVKDLLAEWGIEPELRIDAAAYPKHEYRVQYGETDLAFVSRLLEEAGISYWFEQVEEGDKSSTKLVLGDEPQVREPRAPPIRFLDHPGRRVDGEFVTHVRVAHRVRPGRTTLRDFDFRRRPDYGLFGEAEPAPEPESAYEQYEYAPGAFLVEVDKADGNTPVADDKSKARHDEKHGARLAERALEARRRDKRRVAFESSAFDLAPGVVFSIADHPRNDLGPGTKLLVTETVAQGSRDDEWTLSGEAAFADVPWRPARVTPRPRVDGIQSAIVVGPKGQEIYTDEFGRVRLRFHWDREGEYDDRRTCWVRVSQGWAGAGFGMELVPRIGSEVLVDYEEGDPDRPVVVGRLFNATTRQPYVLPKHKTRSTWKSDSSPDSNGFNEIMFEDQAGKELVYVQAQKNLAKLVKVDEHERTGGSRLAVIGQNLSANVGANDSRTAGTKHLLRMAKPKELGIFEMAQPDVQQLETLFEIVDKKITLTTGEATIVLDGPDIHVEAKGTIKFAADDTLVIQGGPNVFLNCKPADLGPQATADADTKDRVEKPEGRILDSIKKLFGGKPREKPAAEGDRKELEVPHRTQVGGTCGLYALGMVMDYWKTKDDSVQTPTGDELLAKAREKGWTDTGGMWERDLAKLAELYGYDAEYKAGATLDDIRKQIDAGKPVLCTFSVDNSAGDPKIGTDRGHYCVIKGYFTKDGKDYVLAQHGWSNAKHKVWEAKVFEDSWKSYGNSKMVTVTPKPKPNA